MFVIIVLFLDLAKKEKFSEKKTFSPNFFICFGKRSFFVIPFRIWLFQALLKHKMNWPRLEALRKHLHTPDFVFILLVAGYIEIQPQLWYVQLRRLVPQ